MENRFTDLIAEYDESIAALERCIAQRHEELKKIKHKNDDVLRAIHDLETMLGDTKMARDMMQDYSN